MKKTIVALIVVALLSGLTGYAFSDFNKSIFLPAAPGHIVFVTNPVQITDVNINWTSNVVIVTLQNTASQTISGHIILQAANSTATIFTLQASFTVSGPSTGNLVNFNSPTNLQKATALFLTFTS